MVTLEKVNEWARKSCPRWNKNKLSRRAYRKAYRDAAKEWWESPAGQDLMAKYRDRDQDGLCFIDTYPWPYREQDFANWEEDDSSDGYSLISDQSGCVVKYATSYCAWKIFEATGTWPQKTSKERLDARRWVQFLAEAGYTEVVDYLEAGHHYVGIDPDVGEWGIVVWLDGYIDNSPVGYMSSYRNGEFVTWIDDIHCYTWVKIK